MNHFDSARTFADIPELPESRKLLASATLLDLDGQEISKGLITLAVPPNEGVFIPTGQSPRLLDISPGSTVLAEIGTERFRLNSWRPRLDSQRADSRAISRGEGCYNFVRES
jgi:hypothetical protein